MEIQTYSVSVLFVQTCKYIKKKQLGRGWQRATSESLGETRKGAAAHSLPAQDSQPPGEGFDSCAEAGGGRGDSPWAAKDPREDPCRRRLGMYKVHQG